MSLSPGDLTGLNAEQSDGSLDPVVISAPIAGAVLKFTGTPSSPITAGRITVGELEQSSATSGQIIRWNGTAWAPATVAGSGGGTGTVTSVFITPINGVSGTVANPTTTPGISLALGDITPSSVTAPGAVNGGSLGSEGDLTVQGSAAITGAISAFNLSGTNTGDQDLSSYLTAATAATIYQSLNTKLISSIAYAATITPNANTTRLLIVGALTGNLALAAPSGTPDDGQQLSIRLTQDGTGGRTLTLNAIYRLPTDGSITLAPGAGKMTRLLCEWNAAVSKWDVTGNLPGY